MFGITARLRSVKSKLAASAYLTTFIVLITTVFIYSHFLEKEQDARFRNRVVSVARTASILIHADDFDLLRKKDDEKSETYYHIRKTLQDIKRANPQILFIYTLRKTPEKNVFEFVVDADKKPYRIGEKYDVSGQEVIKNGLKYPVAETDFETNRWGKYLTGYAPIMDSSGKTVGIVGVDFAVSTPEEPEESNRGLAFLLAFCSALAITTLFLLRRISKTVKPLNDITTAINGIAQGSFETHLTVSSNDEYEVIANSLNHLSESMEQMQKRIQKELDSSELNHKKTLNVYSDIIYSATRGKLRLLESQNAKSLALEGVLYSESKLEWHEDLKKSAELAQQMFEEQGFGIVKISQALSCIKEAASNAIKHAQKSFIQYRFLDDFIRVIISDQGPGINYNNLPAILFLIPESEDVPEKCGLPAIIEFADRIFMATADEGTVMVMDFQLKKH